MGPGGWVWKKETAIGSGGSTAALLLHVRALTEMADAGREGGDFFAFPLLSPPSPHSTSESMNFYRRTGREGKSERTEGGGFKKKKEEKEATRVGRKNGKKNEWAKKERNKRRHGVEGVERFFPFPPFPLNFFPFLRPTERTRR